MGKFGNDLGGYVGSRLVPMEQSHKTWHGESGFAAMGHAVPAFRKSNAEHHMKEMGFTDAEQRHHIVGVMADQIERDNSWQAMEKALNMGVDTTGVYRLLAVLLTGLPPSHQEADASFLDLVVA